MKKDCCFTNDQHWFRYRAAGLVIENGKALFVTDSTLDYCYTAGGGVHMGEKAEDCVRRELKEETGVDYEIDHLAVICENFFDGHGGSLEGMDCHCLELYFLMKSTGKMNTGSVSVNADGNREKLVWIPIDDIEQYNIKPSFLKNRMREIAGGTGILHIVTEADRNPARKEE